MEYSNILVRSVNWVGDAVMSLPALRALRGRFPDARITLIARPWVAGLLRRESLANEIGLYGPPQGWKGLRYRFDYARGLKQRKFDCAIVFPNSFESATLPYLAGIPARIGYARDGRGLLLTTAIAPPKPGEIPEAEPLFYLEMLRRAGILSALEDPLPFLLERSEEARGNGLELFQRQGVTGRVIGVAPGAANSRAKQWPPGRFAEAATRLAREIGATVALFGSASERALCESIAQMVAAEGIPVKNIAGATTLEDLVDFSAACDLFLTNDSGAMHIASAAGTPTVAVYGPTNEFTTGPAGPRSRVVRETVDCMRCMYRDCPIDHRCMIRLTAERVAREAMELLK